LPIKNCAIKSGSADPPNHMILTSKPGGHELKK